jgi:hypothetical protein
MRATFRKYNLIKQMSRATDSKAVVVSGGVQSINNTFKLGNDLTQKWVQRIQAKVKDSASNEAYSKVASLIDYYNKQVPALKEKVDWNYWEDNIRTSGIVNKYLIK